MTLVDSNDVLKLIKNRMGRMLSGAVDAHGKRKLELIRNLVELSRENGKMKRLVKQLHRGRDVA